MKKSGIWFGAVMVTLLVSGLTADASAATNGGEWRARHSINRRQHEQRERIGEGIENGRLSPREAARLEREQYRFNREEARLRQGGLTRRERERLEDQQDRMSRQIYREKHDHDRR
jgi:hypothetical protein